MCVHAQVCVEYTPSPCPNILRIGKMDRRKGWCAEDSLSVLEAEKVVYFLLGSACTRHLLVGLGGPMLENL